MTGLAGPIGAIRKRIGSSRAVRPTPVAAVGPIGGALVAAAAAPGEPVPFPNPVTVDLTGDEACLVRPQVPVDTTAPPVPPPTSSPTAGPSHPSIPGEASTTTTDPSGVDSDASGRTPGADGANAVPGRPDYTG